LALTTFGVTFDVAFDVTFDLDFDVTFDLEPLMARVLPEAEADEGSF
jgi:hypothetical protein